MSESDMRIDPPRISLRSGGLPVWTKRAHPRWWVWQDLDHPPPDRCEPSRFSLVRSSPRCRWCRRLVRKRKPKAAQRGSHWRGRNGSAPWKQKSLAGTRSESSAPRWRA